MSVLSGGPPPHGKFWESRAQLLAFVRGFFAQRGVLEVETPVLGRCGVTDVHLDSIPAGVSAPGFSGGWLQTSPEYHMKRLLAAGSGPIYQVARVFRNGEVGRRHNPEFSMLEWYRPGFDDRQLMAEVADLVVGWLSCERPETLSYRAVMQRWAGLDPFEASEAELRARCREWMDDPQLAGLDRDGCLDLLMSFAVEPHLGRERPVFVTAYPASQASLARVSEDARGHRVAHRFELYVQGLELCNGYWELTDRSSSGAGSRPTTGCAGLPASRTWRWMRLFWRRWPRACRTAPELRSGWTAC